MWSFLSIFHPLGIPIPMCKKKIRVQQEFCTKLLIVYVYFQCEWAQGTFLPKTAEKTSSSPRTAGVFLCLSICLSVHPSVMNTKTRRFFHVGIKIKISTWSHLSVVPPLRIPIPMCNLVFYSKFVSSTKNYFPPQQ
jgi:hypothetical protein